jgi:hypothetical protein
MNADKILVHCSSRCLWQVDCVIVELEVGTNSKEAVVDFESLGMQSWESRDWSWKENHEDD